MPLLISGVIPVNLSQLHDVSISAPAAGQYLRYSGSVWQNSYLNSDVFNYLNTSLLSTNGVTLDFSIPSNITIGLATVNPTPGTFGATTDIPVITVDAQGRITSVSTVANNPLSGTTNPINTAYGFNALLTNPAGTAGGTSNTAIGVDALSTNYDGYWNTAIGHEALMANTAGIYNTATGAATLFSNTTGAFNSALGGDTLLTNSTGSYNSAIGSRAMQDNISGNENVAIGYSALYTNTIGNNNIAIGAQSLYSATGNNNVALGHGSGQSLGSGSANVIIGSSTGASIADSSNYIIISDGDGIEWVVMNPVSSTATFYSNLAVTGTITGAVSGNASTATTLATGRTFSLSTDATGTSAAFNGSTNVTIPMTLATVNASPQTDTFRKITVNGKGLTTSTSAVAAGDITTALGYTPVNSAGSTMTGLLILSGDPVVALGAATKQYVDNIAAGVNVHQSCETATTAALPACTYANGTSGVGATLTASINGAIGTVGGYATLAVTSRVLVKNQAASLQNGIYTVTSLGAVGAPWVLTRASDFDGSPTSELQAGDLTYVQEGTLIGTQWVETAIGTGAPGDYIIVGTDAIVFSQFSGAGTYVAGTGISIASNTIANTGVLSLTTNSGLSTNISATGNVTVTNTGVTSIVAGTNISISSATGAVTISATGTVPSSTVAATTTITNDVATASVVYPTWVTANTGDMPQKVSSTKLTFVPSTGILSSTGFAGSGAGLTAIPNAALTNSSVTIGSTSIALGSTSTTLAGLTSVTSASFVGAFTGNASTATSATSATTATNIAGGVAGNILYQSAASTTALLTTGTSSQVLVSGAIPSWTNAPTLTGTNFSSIPNAALANSIVTIGTTAISLGTSSTTLAGLTSVTSTTFSGSGSGLTSIPNSALVGSGSITLGSTAMALGSTIVNVSGLTSVTATTFTGALSGNATSATNIAGGAAGSVAYQSGANATVMLAAGTNGYVLTLSAGVPTWAPTAGNVTIADDTTTNATYYVALSTITSGILSTVKVSSSKLTYNPSTGGLNAVSLNATSTKRVKKAIRNLGAKYLLRFKDLKPREYDRKDYVAHEFGFIAEEMALVYPEVVSKDTQGIPNGIDYGKLSTILTAKVQEQQKTIDLLQTQMSKVLEMLKGIK